MVRSDPKREDKEAAIRAIDAAIKPLPLAPRRAAIDVGGQAVRRGAPVRERAESMMLDWDQVRKLHAAGVEIGGHSLTHSVLSELPCSEARREIEDSIARVRQMTGQRDVPFAYPYGSERRSAQTVRDLCRADGASAAVMLVEGRMPGDDDFAIPRTMVAGRIGRRIRWGRYSKALWACELDGLVDVARYLVRAASRRVSGGGFLGRRRCRGGGCRGSTRQRRAKVEEGDVPG